MSETERQRRYLRDPEYHARVHAAAEFLEDWDFREGADEPRSFYINRAMELVDRLDALTRQSTLSVSTSRLQANPPSGPSVPSS